MDNTVYDFLDKHVVNKSLNKIDLDFYVVLITTATNKARYAKNETEKKLAEWFQYALHSELENFIKSSQYRSVAELEKAKADMKIIKEHIDAFLIFANPFSNKVNLTDPTNDKFKTFSASFIRELEKNKMIDKDINISAFLADENILKTFGETLKDDI